MRPGRALKHKHLLTQIFFSERRCFVISVAVTYTYIQPLSLTSFPFALNSLLRERSRQFYSRSLSLDMAGFSFTQLHKVSSTLQNLMFSTPCQRKLSLP